MAHLSKRLGETVAEPALLDRIYSTNRNGTVHEISINTAWQGRTAFRVSDRDQSRIEWGDRDYLIPVGLLQVLGEPIEPQRGDRIEETFDDPTLNQTFEILAPEGEQDWRYSDMTNLLFRVHTKRVIPE